MMFTVLIELSYWSLTINNAVNSYYLYFITVYLFSSSLTPRTFSVNDYTEIYF